MSREEFIGKLQMVYVGDRNAFNDIVVAYDSLLCKNEKAIEYINKEFKDEPYSVFIYGKTNIDNLLNILQNGSDSQ